MLRIHDPHRPCASAFPRRSFLRVGAFTLGGLTLGDVLGLRAAAASGRRPKSAIMIHLSGGPSHLDVYDMKPPASSTPSARTCPGESPQMRDSAHRGSRRFSLADASG